MITTITVRGSFEDLPSGSQARGSVTFRLSHPLQDETGNVIVAATEVVAKLVDGDFEVDLPATNDPTTSPIGVTYRVIEKIKGARNRYYDIELDHDGPNPVELVDISPALDTELFTYTLLTTFNAHRASVGDHLDVDLTGAAIGNVLGFDVDLDLVPLDVATDAEVGAAVLVETNARIADVNVEEAARIAGDNAVAAAMLAALGVHVGALDPHPQYLTATEGNGFYGRLTEPNVWSDPQTITSPGVGLTFDLDTTDPGFVGEGYPLLLEKDGALEWAFNWIPGSGPGSVFYMYNALTDKYPFNVYPDGKVAIEGELQLGADVSIFRGAANTLKTLDTVETPYMRVKDTSVASIEFNVEGAAAGFLSYFANGVADDDVWLEVGDGVWAFDGVGKMWFGYADGWEVNLYASADEVLKTDDNLHVAAKIKTLTSFIGEDQGAGDAYFEMYSYDSGSAFCLDAYDAAAVYQGSFYFDAINDQWKMCDPAFTDVHKIGIGALGIVEFNRPLTVDQPNNALTTPTLTVKASNGMNQDYVTTWLSDDGTDILNLYNPDYWGGFDFEAVGIPVGMAANSAAGVYDGPSLWLSNALGGNLFWGNSAILKWGATGVIIDNNNTETSPTLTVKGTNGTNQDVMARWESDSGSEFVNLYNPDYWGGFDFEVVDSGMGLFASTAPEAFDGGGVFVNSVSAGLLFGTSTRFRVNATGIGFFGTAPVAKAAAIADAAGGAVIDAEARAAINDLLARQRAYGLLAV